MNPTIEDVARKACVSKATVSRVLNKSEKVLDETARKVERAIEELGYVPNAIAQNFRKQESHVLLVIASNFTNPFYAHILSGISDAAQAHGYNAFINSCHGNKSQEFLKKIFEARQADGVILLSINKDDVWLKDFSDHYPVVQCAEYVDGADLPSVSIDNYAAMRGIMQYLLNAGHRHIGIISAANDYISTAQREQAYYDAMDCLHAEETVKNIVRAATDYTFSSGAQAAMELLRENPQITAIACVSDVLALGAISEIQRQGLRVPEDISVVGFDDVDYTKMFHPYLTTVEQPCYQLGVRSVELLCQMINGKRYTPKTLLPYRLHIRESTVSIQGEPETASEHA